MYLPILKYQKKVDTNQTITFICYSWNTVYFGKKKSILWQNTSKFNKEDVTDSGIELSDVCHKNIGKERRDFLVFTQKMNHPSNSSQDVFNVAEIASTPVWKKSHLDSYTYKRTYIIWPGACRKRILKLYYFFIRRSYYLCICIMYTF